MPVMASFTYQPTIRRQPAGAHQAAKRLQTALLRKPTGFMVSLLTPILMLGWLAPSHSQVLELSIEQAELSGVQAHSVLGRFALAKGEAELSFTLVDRWATERDLPMTLSATSQGENWQLRLHPLSLPIVVPIDTRVDSGGNSGFEGVELADASELRAVLNVDAQIFGRNFSQIDRAAVRARISELGFSDETGTIAAEAVVIDTQLELAAAAGRSLHSVADHSWDLTVRSTQGELLWGPAYLDLRRHPLSLDIRGHWPRQEISRLQLDSLYWAQEGLIEARARVQADLDLKSLTSTRSDTDASVTIQSGHLELLYLELPTAYQNFLRTTLAGTLLGNLQTDGSLSGSLSIEENQPVAAEISLKDINLRDLRGSALTLEGLEGKIRWRAQTESDPVISYLNWNQGSLNGIPAGKSSLQFVWQDDMLELSEVARIPILDGALRIDSLSIQNLTQVSREILFDGTLEPLSLSALTEALGLPALAGTLTGRAPGVQYRDQTLTVSGPFAADIFGGQIIGRDLQIKALFSRWPQVTANIDLHNLDLALLSSTLDIGAITGRVGGYVRDLELFAWRPVAFEAMIATDESSLEPRRISVRAINSIANIGGSAGSGVSSALQSGMLRFFDTYRYRRLGLRCTLKDNICLMSGTGTDRQRTGDRYTLLEGAGLPRLDIVGYAGRVNWSQLMQQLASQIRPGPTPLRAP